VTVPLYNLTDTWTSGATVYTAIQMNVTNTGSAAGSKLLDLQIGGNSYFNIDKAGNLAAAQGMNLMASEGSLTVGYYNGGAVFIDARTSAANIMTGSGGAIGFSSTASAFSATPDTAILRDAAGILAQRNSTNAQVFRCYNTFTDGSNYERACFDWSVSTGIGGVATLTLGTQAAGTGTIRAISFVAGTSYPFQFQYDPTTSTSFWYLGNNGTWHGRTSGFESIQLNVQNNTGVILSSNCGLLINSTNNLTGGSIDTGLTRKAAGVISIDDGTFGSSNGTINAKSKAGAPTTSDVPSGTWVLIRDTTNNTTKMYYNNAGTLQTVALV